MGKSRDIELYVDEGDPGADWDVDPAKPWSAFVSSDWLLKPRIVKASTREEAIRLAVAAYRAARRKGETI